MGQHSASLADVGITTNDQHQEVCEAAKANLLFHMPIATHDSILMGALTNQNTIMIGLNTSHTDLEELYRSSHRNLFD